MLALVQERGVSLGMVFLGGTNIRAHQKAAGASRKGDLQKSGTAVKHSADLVAAMASNPTHNRKEIGMRTICTVLGRTFNVGCIATDFKSKPTTGEPRDIVFTIFVENQGWSGTTKFFGTVVEYSAEDITVEDVWFSWRDVAKRRRYIDLRWFLRTAGLVPLSAYLDTSKKEIDAIDIFVSAVASELLNKDPREVVDEEYRLLFKAHKARDLARAETTNADSVDA